MSTTHTPGPWRYTMLADHIPNFAIKASSGIGGPKVALVNYFAGKPANQEANDLTEGEANARLIAAAPELLEVLRKIIPTLEANQFSSDSGGEDYNNEDVIKALDAARAALAKATTP